MLKKLHNRLALTFTIITGSVFTALLVFSLYVSLQQNFENNIRDFSQTVDFLGSVVYSSVYLEQDITVNEKNPYFYHINIDGAENTVSVNNLWQPKADREELFNVVKKDILENANQSSSQMAGTITEAAQIYEDGSVVIAEKAEQSFHFFPFESILLSNQSSAYAYDIYKFGGKKYRCLYSNITLPIVETYLSEVEGTDYMVQMTKERYIDCEIALFEDLSKYYRENAVICLIYFGILVAGLGILFGASRLFTKRLLRSTEESLQREKQFIASASHELRTPLAVIRSSLSAAESCPDDEEAKKYRITADMQAANMGRLVDDLLLAGTNSASWKLEKSEVDVDTLLIEASEVFAPMAKQKGIKLALTLPSEPLPAVNGDKDRLMQIMGILLDNAIEYSPKNSTVEISTKIKNNKLQIFVNDMGEGVPETERRKIFEGFYRYKKNNKEQCTHKHYGLGLSIANELAALHGGKLSCREGENGGTDFVLELAVI